MKLYVVTAVNNPVRYESRYRLYEKFANMVKKSDAVLYTVEVAFGNRPHLVTSADNPCHIQLRTDTELWHKENMLNIGISRLPKDWSYVAWVDADVSFVRPDWVSETLEQLQHYQIVQMFSMAEDLSPNYEPVRRHNGFVYSYANKLKNNDRKYFTWHSGFAWAARREALNNLGGLIDFAILGAGDRHMAHALIGCVNQTVNVKLTANYKNGLSRWQDRAEKYIKRNIGYVSGTLLHYWHGKKKDRRYNDRWQILVNNKFDPSTDLKYDWQGLFQLTDRSPRLRDQIRSYFRSRNEDSVDMD